MALIDQIDEIFTIAREATVQERLSSDPDMPGAVIDGATSRYVDLLEKLHTRLCLMMADGSEDDLRAELV